VKNIFKNISVVALAVYFLSAGIGYNIIKYCCSVCETTKVELCHEETAHQNCCGNLAHDKDNHHHSDEHQCALVYIKVDFPVVEHSQNQKFDPRELDLPIVLAQNSSYSTSFQTQNNLCPHKHFIRGRDILSKISILII